MTMPEQTVSVPLGDRSYNILIQSGLLATLGGSLASLTQSRRVGIVTDRHVARHCLPQVLRSLKSREFTVTSIVLTPGEPTKTLATVSRILDTLAKNKFERTSLLIALGGGVIGDLTGFAAAIYRRGIPYIQIPTTLVAQVDSSVGGKTGVDHRLGKNLIGAFHQPRAVYIDPLTLRTLPGREWVAGIAEVIKYGIIADDVFFTYLEQSMGALLKFDEETVLRVITRSCEIKAKVVAEDEQESDRRRILNYGHTIGHALESLGRYRGMIHGEAVGVGLVQEADLAHYLGLCGGDVVERIRDLVGRTGLSAEIPRVSFQSLWGAMQHDKKVVGGQVFGVWPIRVGAVIIQPLDRKACEDWYRSRQGQKDDAGGGRRLKNSRSRLNASKRR